MPVFKNGDNWVLRDHGGGRENRVFNLNTASDVWRALKLHLIESKNENKIKYHEKGLIRLYERHYGSTK